LSYVIKVEDDSNNPRLEQTFKFYNKKSKNTKLQYLNSLNIIDLLMLVSRLKINRH
jgi:hypothetical protein